MGRVCMFCGHSDVPDTIKVSLVSAIKKMITAKKADTFYVGNHGGFDRMAVNILGQMKSIFPEFQYYVIPAYLPVQKNGDEETVPLLFPEGLELVPPKYAIVHRNRWMVKHADFVIAYVHHGWGGAAQTLKYAEKRGLDIINLGR